jgi:hypothetical protein
MHAMLGLGSRPELGSSSSSKSASGRVRERASATRCYWPTERVVPAVCAASFLVHLSCTGAARFGYALCGDVPVPSTVDRPLVSSLPGAIEQAVVKLHQGSGMQRFASSDPLAGVSLISVSFFFPRRRVARLVEAVMRRAVGSVEIATARGSRTGSDESKADDEAGGR